MKIVRTVTKAGRNMPKFVADARCHGAAHITQANGEGLFVFHTAGSEGEQFATHLSHGEILRALGGVQPFQYFEDQEKRQRYMKVLREINDLLGEDDA